MWAVKGDGQLLAMQALVGLPILDCFSCLQENQVIPIFTIKLKILTNFYTAVIFNDLWSYNTSSGNWTWRGGERYNETIASPSANYPDHIGGIGWPGGTSELSASQHASSIFIFGGYNSETSMPKYHTLSAFI